MSLFGVTVETAHGPTLRFTEADVLGGPNPDPGLDPEPTDPAAWDLKAKAERAATRVLLRFIKPKFTVDTPYGTRSFAPYGEPGATTWPLGAIVAGVFAVFALAGLVLALWTAARR